MGAPCSIAYLPFSTTADMADLPKWARTDDVEGAGGDLGDKLVEQSESDAKPPPPDEAADRVHDEEDVRVIEESPLASRALCLFRTLVVVTIILALAVIAANCYIIYERFDELMGEVWKSLTKCMEGLIACLVWSMLEVLLHQNSTGKCFFQRCPHSLMMTAHPSPLPSVIDIPEQQPAVLAPPPCRPGHGTKQLRVDEVAANFLAYRGCVPDPSGVRV